MNNKTYDCIIAGAGPAGLGCALDLTNKGCRVLLLEKNPLGETSHSWVIWLDLLKKYGLEDAVRREIKSLTFSSFLGSSYTLLKPISASVYENRILTLLVDKIKKNGGTIQENEPFISYRYKKDVILIKTPQSEYTAKLFVDAMGESSSIQEGMGESSDNILGMGCYGYDLSGIQINNPDEALIFDAFFPGKNYFWIIPYSETSAFVGVFFFKQKGTLTFTKAIPALKKYIKLKKLAGTVTKVRQGIIPLSPRPFMQKDKILFIGDSASSPLPSSGFGFAKSFEEGRICGDFVNRCITKKVKLGQFEKEIYEYRYPGYEMHYLISNILINLNDQMLHKAIINMNNIPDDYITHFLKGDDLSLKFILQSFINIRSTYTTHEIKDMAIGQNYKEVMLRLYSVYPKVTIPILKREFKTLLHNIAEF